MGRVLKIVFYALLLALGFLWISTVYKSCKEKKGDPADASEEVDEAFDESPDDEFGDLTEAFDEETGDEFEEGEEKSYKDLDNAIDDVDDLTQPYEEEIVPEPEEVVSKPIIKTELKPAPSKPTYTPPSSSSTSGGYLIVAGNYSIEANAESMRSKLKRMGYNAAEIVQFDNSSFSTVVASRFNNYERALNEAARLKERGIDCYVHKKKD